MSSIAKPSSLRASMATAIEDKSGHDTTSTARTVPFAVVSYSSQADDFPASELNKGVLGRGWQSSRFCFFPQEIVLELQQPSRIINMQLLCHEFKIPSKVEVFVSMMNPYVHSEQAIAQMKRLGYLSLDPNDRSGHQARELKSIYVDSSAAAIRLLLHNCYSNKSNVYNQVGLMAVIITGDPLEGQQMEYFNRHDVTTPSHVSMVQVACTKGMDTRTQAPSPKAVDFDFSEVDSATGTRLRQLFQDKVMAVGNEDYDEAKRLKILIERLKELGKKMKQLERRKFAAVEVEDYDTAKLCKIEMERLQHHDDEGPLEHEQIDKHKASDRLELGTATKTPDNNLQGRTSCEDIMSATCSAIVKKEIWTQIGEDAKHNNVVQLNKKCLEDSGNLTSPCNGILDFKPAYSSFKIQPGDFQGVTIPTVLSSNEKQQTGFAPEILPWYRDHSVLKTSEISPPPTVGQQGTSAPVALATPQIVTRVPRIPLITGAARNEPAEPYLQPASGGGGSSHGSPEKRYQAASPATQQPHQTVCPPNSTPDLAPLKLSTGTQYQVEKEPLLPVSPTITASPPIMHLGETLSKSRKNHEEVCTTSTMTKMTSPPPPPPPATGGVDTGANADQQVRAAPPQQQEQALPVHKGDFQSPFPNGDELVPEPLADSVKMEAGLLLPIIELHQVECLYSKHWQLREKALQFLIDKLDANDLVDEPLPSFRTMNKVLLRTLNDRVANVFNTSLQLLRTVVTTYASAVPHRDLHVASSGFTTILVEKLGDLNARTKEGSFETLMFLASKKEIGLHVLSGPLLKPSKNQGIWRPVLGRLQLLLHAVPLYGIQPPGRTGFPPDALMSFVTQAFNSPNGEVRNAAIKVTTEVYRLMGSPVEKYLKGIKPLIKEILTSSFERVAYESEQGEASAYQERPFSGDELGRCATTRAHNIGLRPLVQEHVEAQEAEEEQQQGCCENKGHETTASFSKTDGSFNRSSLSVQEPKPGEEFEAPVVEVESPTKASPTSCYNNQAATITTIATPVQETAWALSQQSASPVEEDGAGDLVETEAAAVCASVQSHGSDGEASLDTSSYAPLNAEDALMDKDENVDSCLFCGKQDARFKEGDNLDLHFCEQCPMLASCSNCGQIVEISSLKDHYLFECASGKRYVECQKCYLAVPESRLAAHQKSKDCKMCKQHKLLRCPLCYRTVEPSDKGWREHILQQPGCHRNPRTLLHDVPLPPKPVDAFTRPLQAKWNWSLWRS